MTLKSVLVSLSLGIVAFLVVGILVTELVSPWIEFSLFVGIPAGIVAGVVVALATTLVRRRRRGARPESTLDEPISH